MELSTGAWIVVAVVLYAAEILSPGFVMLPFAIGATTAAVMDGMGVDPQWQWVAFVGVSSVLFVVGQRYLRRKR